MWRLIYHWLLAPVLLCALYQRSSSPELIPTYLGVQSVMTVNGHRVSPSPSRDSKYCHTRYCPQNDLSHPLQRPSGRWSPPQHRCWCCWPLIIIWLMFWWLLWKIEIFIQPTVCLPLSNIKKSAAIFLVYSCKRFISSALIYWEQSHIGNDTRRNHGVRLTKPTQ